MCCKRKKTRYLSTLRLILTLMMEHYNGRINYLIIHKIIILICEAPLDDVQNNCVLVCREQKINPLSVGIDVRRQNLIPALKE